MHKYINFPIEAKGYGNNNEFLDTRCRNSICVDETASLPAALMAFTIVNDHTGAAFYASASHVCLAELQESSTWMTRSLGLSFQTGFLAAKDA